MIVIKGKELDFNFINADHVQKWEDSRKKLAEKHGEMAQLNPAEIGLQEYSDLLRQACTIIFNLFDDIFGDNTSNELFDSECDFMECMEAYGEFEDAIAKQADAFAEKMSRFTPVVTNP